MGFWRRATQKFALSESFDFNFISQCWKSRIENPTDVTIFSQLWLLRVMWVIVRLHVSLKKFLLYFFAPNPYNHPSDIRLTFEVVEKSGSCVYLLNQIFHEILNFKGLWRRFVIISLAHHICLKITSVLCRCEIGHQQKVRIWPPYRGFNQFLWGYISCSD